AARRTRSKRGRSETTSNCRRPPRSAGLSFGRPFARLQQRSLQSLVVLPVPLLGWAQAKRLIHARMAIQTKLRFHTELQQRIVPFSLFAPFVERVIKAGRPLSRSVAILIRVCIAAPLVSETIRICRRGSRKI